MKRIKNFVIMFLMGLMMSLGSCGESSLKTINEKIEKEGTSATFTQKEYVAMADYLDKNYMKMFKEFSKLDYEDDDIEEKIDKLENKYPNINEYMMILTLADYEGQLDEQTSVKVKKIINEVKDVYKNNYGIDFNDKEKENLKQHTKSNKLSQVFIDYCFDGYYICHIENNGVSFYLTYIRQMGEGAIQLSDGEVLLLKYNERLGQYDLCDVYTLEEFKTSEYVLLEIEDDDDSVNGIIQNTDKGENLKFSGILIGN